MRMRPAVPDVPSTMAGMTRCAIISTTLPTLHGALRYWPENMPPTEKSKYEISEVHQYQRQQKVRHRKAEEPNECEEVVPNRVGPDRRVYSHRHGENPRDYKW